ncbi:MAG TPA: Mur ligase family protein [Steroidobacteraceae bacterium]|nr:Mur ligase family protein [Steroidobacteraceae bacterium]
MRVNRARAHLGWEETGIVARRHAGGASLSIAAPVDLLFLATEVNEWALCASLEEREPALKRDLEAALLAAAIGNVPGSAGTAGPADIDAPVLEAAAALARFKRLAALEARPALRALLAEATVRALPCVLDEQLLTLGAGCGGRGFALGDLPAPLAVPWAELHDIPTALITGSNGKTTTVRLLAACAREQGWRAAYNCTDGVFVGSEAVASGDYSGPAGARRVLRDLRTEAAVLEVARGGILRRGVAVTRARVALVTNISADHFGEYGIDDLDGLADAKLSVAAVLPEDGLLVLNADDPTLCAKAEGLARRFGRAPPLAWFALDFDRAWLQAQRAPGGGTCGVRAGRLLLSGEHDLGAVSAMPLTIEGKARYNIANLAGAALAAAALGVSPAAIARVYARFGAELADNPGRMMRFNAGGVRVLVDYAHNPDGLRGFLQVAATMRAPQGRLGLVLGHAGNRTDEDVRALARVAAEFKPELIVIKEDEAHLRGRPIGDVPFIIRTELLRLGLPESALPMRASELDAAQYALEWARPGDVLALPIHAASARAEVLRILAER